MSPHRTQLTVVSRPGGFEILGAIHHYPYHDQCSSGQRLSHVFCVLCAGGQQLCDDLEALANECARIANRARAKLEGQSATRHKPCPLQPKISVVAC